MVVSIVVRPGDRVMANQNESHAMKTGKVVKAALVIVSKSRSFSPYDRSLLGRLAEEQLL